MAGAAFVATGARSVDGVGATFSPPVHAPEQHRTREHCGHRSKPTRHGRRWYGLVQALHGRARGRRYSSVLTMETAESPPSPPTRVSRGRLLPVWGPPSTGPVRSSVLVNNAATNPYLGPMIDIDLPRFDARCAGELRRPPAW